MRTCTAGVTKFYGNFFIGALDFAILPYSLTLCAFAKNRNHMDPAEFAMGVAACVALSTLVPILPELTSFTIAIACFATSLALASMFLSYPLALLIDAFDGASYSSASYAYHG